MGEYTVVKVFTGGDDCSLILTRFCWEFSHALIILNPTAQSNKKLPIKGVSCFGEFLCNLLCKNLKPLQAPFRLSSLRHRPEAFRFLILSHPYFYKLYL